MNKPAVPAQTISAPDPISRVLDDLGHWELELKKAGNTRVDLRAVIVRILRIADEGEPPIDNTGDDT